MFDDVSYWEDFNADAVDEGQPDATADTASADPLENYTGPTFLDL